MVKSRKYVVIRYNKDTDGVIDRLNPKNIEDVEIYDTNRDICKEYNLLNYEVKNIVNGNTSGKYPTTPLYEFCKYHDIISVFYNKIHFYSEPIRKVLVKYYTYKGNTRYL